jgi:hypothetical protein
MKKDKLGDIPKNLLGDNKFLGSSESFRSQFKNYPDWEKSSQSNLAMKFLETRQQRLAQMNEVEIQEAEIAFERFKESIDSDRPDDAKLYL